MNKAAIEKFAVWARTKLISEITYKMGLLGITEKGIAEPLPQSTGDLQVFDIGTKNYAEVTGTAVKQRAALVSEVRQREKTADYGTVLSSVIEEVAYTWFNRLIAVRFMEVNDYLPSRVRVLSSENPAKTEPDLVTDPFDTDLAFTPFEQDRIVQLKDENRLDELFRMLFIKQCNQLHDILPELFEKTDDYSELLLTISFTDKDGVIYHLTHDIAEDDFNVEKEGQVEIIGWMYQYYNTELKADTFAQLKKNVKITKERIPAATQLFTPDWIVRYMVENSLGRLWVEGHPNDDLKANWKYYLEEAEQEPEVQAQLAKMREDYAKLDPEDIKLIDPCMGSGHILVYAFDVLMQIYEAQGYTQRDAARRIIENNLFGLDIDKRAYQLSYFALMMKARQYSRRIFSKHIKPNVFVIDDNSALTADTIEYIAKGDQKIKADLHSISDDLYNAKEYGSIIDVAPVDFGAIYDRIEEIRNSEPDLFSTQIPDQITPIIRQAEVMAQKYDVVVTNPPYMGSSGMSAKLSDYVKTNYPDSKSDLFAVFIERCGQMARQNGYQAMITQHAWMFLSSFEKLRSKLLTVDIVNMAHLGARAFEEIGGEVVQTTSFVVRKSHITDYKGEYCRLIEPTSQQGKEDMFLAGENRYAANQSNFSKIPGSPVAYWVSKRFSKVFEEKHISDVAKVVTGMTTADNERFLRLWFEISLSTFSIKQKSNPKWFPYQKGGDFCKWYGDNEYVVNWENNGLAIKNNIDPKTKKVRSGSYNEIYITKKGLTWTYITSGPLGVRFVPDGFLFDNKGSMIFFGDEESIYTNLGFLCGTIAKIVSQILNPTISFQPGNMATMPSPKISEKKELIIPKVKENIKYARNDWDSYETSWDFKRNPLV